MGTKRQDFVVTARTLAFILGETRSQCRVLSRERVDLTYDLCPILKISPCLLSWEQRQEVGRPSARVARIHAGDEGDSDQQDSCGGWRGGRRSGQILDLFQDKVRRILWV